MTGAAASVAGDLTFATAVERRAELLRTLEAAPPGPWVLDLSAVGHADTAGISLLLELTRLARAGGRELRITGLPPAMRRLVDFFELGELLRVAA
ncbi:MAG TPA: STAS domain-containing protein [Candidatus Binatia bacterium]|nr:STAS domain-containing protein [Candidatus Binatia bacterium]